MNSDFKLIYLETVAMVKCNRCDEEVDLSFPADEEVDERAVEIAFFREHDCSTEENEE